MLKNILVLVTIPSFIMGLCQKIIIKKKIKMIVEQSLPNANGVVSTTCSTWWERRWAIFSQEHSTAKTVLLSISQNGPNFLFHLFFTSFSLPFYFFPFSPFPFSLFPFHSFSLHITRKEREKELVLCIFNARSEQE